jgi:hypothetical protein
MMEQMVDHPGSTRTTLGILYQVALISSQNEDFQKKLDAKGLRISHFLNFGSSKLFTAIPPQKWAGIVWTSTKGYIGIYSEIDPVVGRSTIFDIDEELAVNIQKSTSQSLDAELKIDDSTTLAIFSCFNRELAQALLSLREEILDVEQGVVANDEFIDGKNCFQVNNSIFPNGTLNTLEKSFIHKYWTTGWSSNFAVKWDKQQLIDIPKERYRSSTGEWNERLLKEECPTLYKHLLAHKKSLSEKVEKGSKSAPWFSLHRNRGGRIYGKNKLILPQMLNWSNKVLVYIDTEGLGVPFSHNVVWPKAGYRQDWLYALAGWLNSGIVAFYLNRLFGAKPRGKGGEITGEKVKEIPVPRCIVFPDERPEIEALVCRLADTTKKAIDGDFKNTHQQALDATSTEIVLKLCSDMEINEDTIYRDEMIPA